VDLTAYRTQAEAFVSALDREYYLHFSGQQDEFDIEPIYERHAGLFAREVVEELREAGNRALLEFAVHGLIGRATKAEEAELARREASLELELDGERLPFRQAAVVLEGFPSDDAFAVLARHRVRYVAVHWDMYVDRKNEIRRRLQPYAGNLKILADDPRMTLYEVVRYP